MLLRRARAGLLALPLLFACAAPGPRWSALPADDPRPAALLESFSRAALERRALRGRARLAVDAGAEGVRLRARQVIALERPARLRVEVQGLLSETLAVLVTDGDRYELFRAADRSYTSGPLHDGLLRENVHVDLAPQQVVDLLLGAPLPDPSYAPAAALGDGAGGVRLDLADPAGRVRWRASFDAAAQLRRLEVFDAGGAALWSARWEDYRPLGGVAFAHALVLEMAGTDTRAEIDLRDVELNPALSPDIFRLRAPPGRAAAGREGRS